MIDDFIRYTKIDTKCDPEGKSSPSTPGQLELQKIVADDLRNAGVKDVEATEEGFIYATIPSNVPGGHPASGKVPTIGFLAHLDTANEAPGANVKARFIENYQGGDITYPSNPDLVLNYELAPNLKHCIGHTVITSDGTTLLGADDKAGLAVLVELARHYNEGGNELHGDIRIAIIPDEEIGVGTEKLDLKKFGCDVAYTIDGGEMGEIDIESFNGYMGKITVGGYAAFPGYGKGVYVNAIQVLSEIIAKMEESRWPQNGAGRDPIWWIQSMTGAVADAEAAIYLRDFDLEGIETQKKMVNGYVAEVQKQFPKAKISVDINETYKNYKYELEKDSRVVEYAKEAMNKAGIEPKLNYVRGGNDSCHLCFSGLLSTNLFVGMQNMHSFAEWTTVEMIEGSLKTVISLASVWVEHAK